MLVKVLDENRVKILMEDQDIDLYDLPFEKLNYDDPFSRAFIYELIQITYDQTGVNFQDCRLMIEVVPGVSRTYYILLTKMQLEGREKIEFDKADRTELEMYIFRVERGSDVLKFFRSLKTHQPEKSDLYFYNGSYYIALSFPPHFSNDPAFLRFLHCLEEFGGRCRFRYTNESILREWGERLLGPDAFRVLGK
ncbi:MAG: adaptor protein MecA [Clostridia bacterium]|nr:adaptor protein MecA [Clostridia bacterium]